MGRIKILPDSIANKIAAGEVVERPASVVKELLENSLDAGATRVRVEVEGGGKKRIHVVDDGCGMVRDDALTAFERHATSKLRSTDDLLSIATLGFRGEALPSIAAVSRLVLETRDAQEAAGTRIEIAGGRLLNVQEAGMPAGTAITVSNLFYNTPARRKFLRSEPTELSHIASLVTHYALASPEKSFTLSTQTGEMVNVSPVGTLRERVFQLFGGELLEDLVEFGPHTTEIFSSPSEAAWTEPSDPPAAPQIVTFSGFISRPQVQKLNRNWIYIFVNRRLVRDRVLLHAVREAYRNLLPAQAFPVALLFLEMPYGEVDVNVHPAKVEVRFRHQIFVHDLVRDTLRECLAANKPVSTFPAEAVWAPEPPSAQAAQAAASSSNAIGNVAGAGEFQLREPRLPSLEAPFHFEPGTEIFPQYAAPGCAPPASASEVFGEGSPLSAESELAELRPLGQIQESFIVAASPSGLWLIDQHVAHERVLFERFLSEREKGLLERQRLLLPYVLRLTAAQQVLWSQLAEELEAAGFENEPFGGNTVAVKTAPAGVKAGDVEKLLAELLESMGADSRAVSSETVRHKIAASVACHAAIKVNMPLEPRKMEWLLAELAATRFPMSCPHGRPVVLKYGMKEILKAFHRI